MPMDTLSLHHIRRAFGSTLAVEDVSFSVQAGEVMAILGPSGCGKSTLLGIIAGLDRPDGGEVRWEGQPLTAVPPHLRNFGLMFQDFALFPHRNVFDNVAFGLQMARWSAAEIKPRVAEMLALVGLPNFGLRDVSTLSGGEQQRVALARALAPQPRLLMLDEPLGALDRTLRERLVEDLHEILSRIRQTTLYVTHDQEEAFTLAQRVVVMNAGRVEQIDTPQRVYRQPASEFVARFLGMNNLIPGTAQGDVAETPLGRLPLPHRALGPITLLLRPDEVILNGQGTCQLQGVVTETSFRGRSSRITVNVHGHSLQLDIAANQPLPLQNESVILAFQPEEALQIFSAERPE